MTDSTTPRRHPSYKARTCEVCGATYHPTYGAQRTCGRFCGVFLREGMPLSMPRLHGQHSDLTQCARCGRPMEKRPSAVYCPTCAHDRAMAGVWVDGVKLCSECAVPIPVYKGSGNLCDSCKDGHARVRSSDHHLDRQNRRRAAKHGGKIVELVRRSVVLERAEYLCYRCGQRTDPTADRVSPLYPHTDHVIPLCKGGEHSYANVRCCCRACNIEKGAGLP